MIRLLVFCLLLITCVHGIVLAQRDSLEKKNGITLRPVDPKSVNPFLTDSALSANRQKFVADSLASFYLMPDSSKMHTSFIDSIKLAGSQANFFSGIVATKKSDKGYAGNARQLREPWVIYVIIGLLVYTALLNLVFGADMRGVIQSFYNTRSISQSDKDSGLINSRAFMGLILLFCLTAGLVLYLLSRYYGVTYPFHGIQLFGMLSLTIGLMVALKFLLLKFVGFIFDVTGQVSEYITVLNLTYFSLALMLLCVLLCFGLLANRFVPLLLRVTLVATGIIFVWQYLRNSLGVISGFRFRKFYLFVYLCALEICPVLILIKALNI